MAEKERFKLTIIGFHLKSRVQLLLLTSKSCLLSVAFA
ncbi:hypothetical protein COLO4_06583 [Corchorus olitorius]|uniref:Uncharacterized protein n=1 Tax=Corchorus olitorius TaxID=93759 RepID=A0A1R3KMV1_9ROSI|nr:hypothetical protein COLO4_06583 [Corchorus olitorius]